MKMYVARDKSGALWLYQKKPHLSEGTFYSDQRGESMPIHVCSFSEVTFENSPVEVELMLRFKKKDIPPAPAPDTYPTP